MMLWVISLMCVVGGQVLYLSMLHFGTLFCKHIGTVRTR
jgi:hypothetical protein